MGLERERFERAEPHTGLGSGKERIGDVGGYRVGKQIENPSLTVACC